MPNYTPQPANTSEELQTNFELAVRLTAFNDADDIIELHNKIIADHDAKLYAALEALPLPQGVDPTCHRLILASARKVFNTKEEADGDSK